VFGDIVSQPQRGVVFAFFQEDDGLTPDLDHMGKLELGKVSKRWAAPSNENEGQ
jgi:hypothetical protein